jgi:PTH1 family peptidyl-tRNA hydrolase
MALPAGTIRLRAKGSAGGHNGLADVIRAVGGNAFPRLRIGIGAAPGPIDPVDYVLGKLSEDELALANRAIDDACQAVETWLTDGIDATMTRFNSRSEPDDEK